MPARTLEQTQRQERVTGKGSIASVEDKVRDSNGVDSTSDQYAIATLASVKIEHISDDDEDSRYLTQWIHTESSKGRALKEATPGRVVKEEEEEAVRQKEKVAQWVLRKIESTKNAQDKETLEDHEMWKAVFYFAFSVHRKGS